MRTPRAQECALTRCSHASFSDAPFVPESERVEHAARLQLDVALAGELIEARHRRAHAKRVVKLLRAATTALGAANALLETDIGAHHSALAQLQVGADALVSASTHDGPNAHRALQAAVGREYQLATLDDNLRDAAQHVANKRRELWAARRAARTAPREPLDDEGRTRQEANTDAFLLGAVTPPHFVPVIDEAENAVLRRISRAIVAVADATVVYGWSRLRRTAELPTDAERVDTSAQSPTTLKVQVPTGDLLGLSSDDDEFHSAAGSGTEA